jgi:hypothetical protein
MVASRVGGSDLLLPNRRSPPPPRGISKRTMCRPTRLQFRGRLIRLGEMSEDDAQPLHRGSGGSTYTRKAHATREAPSVVRPASGKGGCPQRSRLRRRCPRVRRAIGCATEAPSLHQSYPVSAVLRTSPPPQSARPVPHGRPVGPVIPDLGAQPRQPKDAAVKHCGSCRTSLVHH